MQFQWVRFWFEFFKSQMILWNFPGIVTRILLLHFKNDLINIPIRKWPWNSCEILKRFWSEIFSRNRWPRVLVKFLQGLIRILQEILISFLIRKLDDHGTLVKFQRVSTRIILKELDEPRILVKFFKNFDENSGGQP